MLQRHHFKELTIRPKIAMVRMNQENHVWIYFENQNQSTVQYKSTIQRLKALTVLTLFGNSYVCLFFFFFLISNVIVWVLENLFFYYVKISAFLSHFLLSQICQMFHFSYPEFDQWHPFEDPRRYLDRCWGTGSCQILHLGLVCGDLQRVHLRPAGGDAQNQEGPSSGSETIWG